MDCSFPLMHNDLGSLILTTPKERRTHSFVFIAKSAFKALG